MNINYEEQDGKILVELAGELDTPASEEIQPVIDKLLTKCDHDIIVDFEKLTYIASSGLRQMLQLKKAAGANSKTIEIKNVRPDILEVFKVTCLDRIFGLK